MRVSPLPYPRIEADAVDGQQNTGLVKSPSFPRKKVMTRFVSFLGLTRGSASLPSPLRHDEGPLVHP